MKHTKEVLVFGSLMFVAAVFSACNKTEPVSSPTASKSSLMLLKAGSKFTTSGSGNTIPLPFGTLSLESFNVNLSGITIQENSGFNGEQQGENSDGNSNDGGTEIETPDLHLNGPFSFDIAGGTVNIGTFDIYPGTFKQVDVFFLQTSGQPFDGGSVAIKGKYTVPDGSVLPVILHSKFSQSFQTQIAGNGITIIQNSKVPVTILFNFDKMFAQFDLSKAAVTNGTILVDDSNNLQLLQLFERNLNSSVELEN